MAYKLVLDNETVNYEMILRAVNHLIFSKEVDEDLIVVHNERSIDCYAIVNSDKKMSNYNEMYFKDAFGVEAIEL